MPVERELSLRGARLAELGQNGAADAAGGADARYGQLKRQADGMRRPMARATQSFTATVDGERQEVIAGHTRVVPTHQLVRQRPQAWTIVETRRRRPSGAALARFLES